MMTEDNKNYYIKLITESLVNDPEIYNAIREMHNSAIQLQNTLVQRLPYNITKTIFQNTISNVINTIKPAISEASSDNEQSNVSHTNENTPAVSTDTIQTDTEQTQTIINEPQSETIKTNTVKTTKKPSAKKTDWSKSPDLSLRQAFARHKRASKPLEPELLAELIKRFPGFDPEKQIFTGAKRPKKDTDWTKSSDMSLRQAFARRKKTSTPLEPELVAELIKRFPNFNSETQTFTGAQRPKKNTDWSKSSDMSLRQTVSNHKKTGKALEPELLAELIKRFPNFNSETQNFMAVKKDTDWSKSTDVSLRQAFARRKKTNTPIEPELLAELIKRFPNFNSETQTFTGAQRPRKNTDRSKSTDTSLRQTFARRKKTNTPIEPELLAELTKRFPNFNSETQTFTGAQRPKKNTDWTKSSDKSLRQAFAHRKKTGKALEPELLAELIKRFPNFDSEKQIFTGAQSPRKNTDWSKSPDAFLRYNFRYRKKTGKALEPELLAELTKRFPNFDSEKQNFTGTKKPKKNTDWSKSPDSSLRQTFSNRKKAGKAIEPKLLAELIKRFPNFDSEKQIFTGAKKPRKNTDWSKSTDTSLRQAFAHRKKADKPIEPELLAELTKRFPGFDPETQTFTGAKKPKKNTDWTKSSDSSLRHTFANRKKTNTPIEPELLAELIKRFPNFDSEKQIFTGAKKPKKNIDWSKSSDSSLRHTFANRKKNNTPIDPEMLAELTKRFPKFDSEKQIFTGKQKKRPAPATKTPTTTNIQNQEYTSGRKNWTKAKDAALHMALSQRKKDKQPIEPELLAELTKRFPNFDPEKKIFIYKIDFTKSTDKSIINIYSQRKAAKTPLEPELLTELANRFANFDPETQTLLPKANYKKATDAALRKLASEKQKNHEKLEPQLVEELSRRFPDFNQNIHKFKLPVSKQTQTKPVDTQNKKIAKQTKNLAQQEQISNKIQVPENKTWFPVYISDDAFKKQTHLIYNTELEQRILLPNSQGYANYDLCLFDCLSQIAVIRKTIYYYNKNGIIRENYEKTLHIIDCSCGIEYQKAQYLSSVKYDPAMHALYINNKNSNYIIDADGAQFPITYTPRNLKTIEAMDKNKQTIIIINDTATTHNNFVIKPLQKAAQQIKLIQELILAAHKQSQNPQPEQIPENITEKTEKLFVFQDRVHQSLNNTYYNIYINDKRILSNCIDADIELLLSNKVMAITHFVDNKKHIDIYDNTEKSLVPTQIDKYTKKYTYATDYSLTDKGIRLNMSNNTVTNIPLNKLNQSNKDYIFVITTQKQK